MENNTEKIIPAKAFSIVEIVGGFDIQIAEPCDSGYLRSKGLMKKCVKHIDVTKPYRRNDYDLPRTEEGDSCLG